jgi:tight adherence protein B
MVDMFDAMFIRVEPRWCVAAILVSMAAFGGLGWWLTSALPSGMGYLMLRLGIVTFLVVAPFGLPIGFRLPRKIVQMLWDWRIARFEDQLLDALAFMSNGLRSGLSLIQTMEMVAEELSNPISQEFGLVLSEQRVGVPFEEALLNLEERIGSEDAQIMVTSINILRQSGGNLSETFQTISYTIRERKKVKGKIKTMTAQGVAQAAIITVMPFALAAVLWMFDHELVERMWSTWLGWVFIFFLLFLQTIGALIMRKIAKRLETSSLGRGTAPTGCSFLAADCSSRRQPRPDASSARRQDRVPESSPGERFMCSRCGGPLHLRQPRDGPGSRTSHHPSAIILVSLSPAAPTWPSWTTWSNSYAILYVQPLPARPTAFACAIDCVPIYRHAPRFHDPKHSSRPPANIQAGYGRSDLRLPRHHSHR